MPIRAQARDAKYPGWRRGITLNSQLERSAMHAKAACSVAAFTLWIGALTGCNSAAKPMNHYEEGGTQGSVAVVANDTVILDLPSVKIDDGSTIITGTVHRRPRITGEIAGRVDIEFLGPDGEYLDGLPALLTPRTVPADPNTSTTYFTTYGYVPPAGSTVRVHFVDHETQIEEDAAGNNYGYGGGNAGRGGSGGSQVHNSNKAHSTGMGTHTGGHGGMHW
jgi:hypothetical protein